MRAMLLAILGMSLGCTRSSDQPRPKAVAEHAVDAATPSAPLADAGVTAKASPASLLSIVARAPIGWRQARSQKSQEIAMALPLMQRLPDGGLVVASEYARGQATGSGPLTVELHGRGFEHEITYRYGEIQGMQSIRWVWSDTSLTIVSNEEATMRSGPRVTSYKLGPKGFELRGGSVGYWSAVTRAGSVLALERTAYEIPNSSIYPKGSAYAQNAWGLRPARVAVLSGKAPAPVIPAGVCALAMSAAPDGALAIAVDMCGQEDGPLGILRYPPSSTEAKVEWFTAPALVDGERPETVVLAASEREMYISDGSGLQAWDGKAWASTPAPSGQGIVSLSRGPDGVLWAVSRPGRLTKRAAAGAMWTELALPQAPAEALEEHPYAAPEITNQSHFIKDATAALERVQLPSGGALEALLVDAAGDEVLVLATVEAQAFVLSTRPRSPVARLPSVATQRARIMQTLKPDMMTAKTKYCRATFLMFADGTSAEAIRTRLGTPPVGAEVPMIGEAIVEGQRRIVVYGEEAEVLAAAKQLASLAPRRACSPAVIEKPL